MILQTITSKLLSVRESGVLFTSVSVGTFVTILNTERTAGVPLRPSEAGRARRRGQDAGNPPRFRGCFNTASVPASPASPAPRPAPKKFFLRSRPG